MKVLVADILKSGAQTLINTVKAVMEWKQKRRPPLDQSQVASAIRNLAMLRWLSVKFDPNLPVVSEDEFASV